jgi:creatinine amidohydrolase/Fe(II)-dependent formamide hydrolase-like protein
MSHGSNFHLLRDLHRKMSEDRTVAVPKKKYLSCLTFLEVEEELSRRPELILPLGGCEPYGPCGCLGTATACAEALAGALAEKLDIMYAPAFAIGCSTAYGAFGGTAAIKPRTLTNSLGEIILRWHVQGFRTLIIIDCLFDNSKAVDEAIRRIKTAKPEMKIISFSLQRDERVRAFIGRHCRGKEPGRTEYGILSLAAHIDPLLVRPAGEKNRPAAAATPTDIKRYTAWRKRGADPQEFRKVFPECSASGSAYGFDPVFGKDLFEFIIELLVDSVKQFTL